MNLVLTRRFEELSLNAWPSLRTAYYDGWILRFASGYTRRANSVCPLYSSTLDVYEKIHHCEHAYRECGQRVVFKVTPAAYPIELDATLADAGYEQQAPTSIQTLQLTNDDSRFRDAAARASSTDRMSLETDPSDEWLERFARFSGVDQRHLGTMGKMLRKIVAEHRFATLWDGAEPVSVGMVVVERGYVGLFDVATTEDARNRGYGTSLVTQLLQWGEARGGRVAYLQVTRDNSAALHVYGKLGFKEAYLYWYRVKN